jgi:MraZ protein
LSEAWGTANIKLDDKNRMILPAKARASFADGTYLTRGQSECIFLFTRSQFDAYREMNRNQVPQGMPAIAFDRIFFSSVVAQDQDKQGRIGIPQSLREYAGLTRELTVITMEARMEIWDTERWQVYLDQYAKPFSQLVEGVR